MFRGFLKDTKAYPTLQWFSKSIRKSSIVNVSISFLRSAKEGGAYHT